TGQGRAPSTRRTIPPCGLKAPGPGRFLSDGNEWRDLDFGKTSIGFMDNIRNFLMEREADYQQSDLKNGSC
ncbi:MAG: hypothetical protein R6U86_07440, partial [Bacteroidales bacterium]